MNSIFLDPEAITPEMNALSLVLKQSFYLWTPLIHILFDSRFYSLFFTSKQKRIARRINKEIQEQTKSFYKNPNENHDTNKSKLEKQTCTNSSSKYFINFSYISCQYNVVKL